MRKTKIVIVYLVGGSGTRLWPLSRKKQPKPFVELLSKRSLFSQTLERHKELSASQLIISNTEQIDLVKQTLKKSKLSNPIEIISEPIPRNTAAAIALACHQVNPSDILIVVSSDHVIDSDRYLESLSIAVQAAKEKKIALFGIIPKSAETGYGYIQTNGQQNKNTLTEIASFHEKPSQETAEKYLETGNYLWNSGIFCFEAETMLSELKNHCPSIYENSLKALENTETNTTLIKIKEDYMKKIPEEAIDIAIMEKSKHTVVIPVDWNWTDLGSFDSIYAHFDKDSKENVIDGNVLQKSSSNNLILATGNRMVCTNGVNNTIIVDTPDALLISGKNESSSLKSLLKEVEKENPKLLIEHQTTERPWGYFTVLHESEGYKVKEIGVTPNQRLSLQKHKHRSEHWTIVKGTAIVTIDDQTHSLGENKSIYIPKGAIHRLENKTDKLIKVIEVQYGDYLGEDDIIRIEDDYQRLA